MEKYEVPGNIPISPSKKIIVNSEEGDMTKSQVLTK